MKSIKDSQNKFFYLMGDLIDLAKENLQLLDKNVFNNLFYVGVLKQFYTVRIQGPRQSGQTTAIKKYMSRVDNCVGITDSFRESERTGFKNIDNIKNEFIGIKFNYDIVFLDNTSHICVEKISDLYQIIAESGTYPIIVLVG